MKLKHFIKIISSDMNKERRSIFYSTAKDILGEKIKVIKTTNNDGQVTSTFMFHKKDDNGDSYIIPLTQSPTEDEIENLIEKLIKVLYVGNFSIESSLVLVKDINDNHLLPEEYDSLAEQFSKKMHEKWLNERTTNGWRYGEAWDNQEKTHPLIKPWNQLSDLEKNIDPSLLNEFVDILKNNGFKITKK